MAPKKQIEREEAIRELRKHFHPGDTVYTKLLHCAKSGMMRVVDVFLIRDNEPLCLTWSVAKAIGFSYNTKHEGIRVDGCGMDVGFEVVYNLAYALFPEGFGCTGERCPSNDHSNGDRDRTPHDDGTPRNSEEVGTDIPAKRAHRHWHTSGAYAFRHRWL